MNLSLFRAHLGRCLIALLRCALLDFAFQLDLGASPIATETETSTDLRPIDALAQIECVMPDGRVVRVSNADRNGPATVKNDAISCQLREGETVFIIAYPKTRVLDHLIFINENAAACGLLKIAVSDSPLPADSPGWTTVDGAIPFARKRLFNLSMLGVEAKYVKLSFEVHKPDNMTGMSIDPRQLHRMATVAMN
jgi:hypothetical protein